MSNPFETIETRLDKIESLIQGLQPFKVQQPAPEAKTERPISQAEAVEFLGKSRQTLINWRKKRAITAYRLSGRIYYKPSELISALQKLG